VKTTLTPDIEYSLSVLNYLRSSYQGRYVFFKVLSDFGVPGVDPQELQRSGEALQRIGQWLNELFQGSPLFAAHWTTPGTFDAKRALDMLDAMKPELRWVSDVCSRATSRGDLATLPRDELQVLCACLARMKVASHFYCLGNIQFGEAMKLTEFTAYHRGLEPRLLAEVELTYTASQALTNPENDLGPTFLAGFGTECAKLSPLALTQVHDINILTAPFRGGLTFLTVEFVEQEGAKWLNQGFTPTDAGYWRAYGTDPAEAALWRKGGIELPAVMVTWKEAGFSATEATLWLRAGLDPLEAVKWQSLGFTPQDARSYRERGINDPTKVPRIPKTHPN
jgi:hypothetical protein